MSSSQETSKMMNSTSGSNLNIQTLLQERDTLRAQNDQLYRLLEKQRQVIFALREACTTEVSATSSSSQDLLPPRSDSHKQGISGSFQASPRMTSLSSPVLSSIASPALPTKSSSSQRTHMPSPNDPTLNGSELPENPFQDDDETDSGRDLPPLPPRATSTNQSITRPMSNSTTNSPTQHDPTRIGKVRYIPPAPALYLRPYPIPNLQNAEMNLFNSPNTLSIRVICSTIKPSSKSQVLYFILHVASADLSWLIEKTWHDFYQLDTEIRGRGNDFMKLPDRQVLQSLAPAKSVKRKWIAERYLQGLGQNLKNCHTQVIQFLLSNLYLPPPVKDVTGQWPADKVRKDGFLVKKGKNRTWKPRWFALINTTLFFFETYTKDPTSNPSGSIEMKNATVVSLDMEMQGEFWIDEDDDGRGDIGDGEYRHAMQIKEGRKGSTPYVFCAQDDYDRDEWVRALEAVIQSSPGQHDSLNSNSPASNTIQPNRESQQSENVQPSSAQSSIRSEMALMNPLSRLRENDLTDSTDSLAAIHNISSSHEHEQQDSQKQDQAQPSQHSSLANAQSMRLINTSPHHNQLHHASTPNLGEQKHPAIRPEILQANLASRKRYESKQANAKATKNWFGQPSSNANAVAPAQGKEEDDRGNRMTAFFFKKRNQTTNNSAVKMRFGRDKSQNAMATNTGSGSSRPVFGVPLEEATMVAQISERYPLPAVVYRCIEYLDKKGASEEEGVYRLSGSQATIKNLKEKFDQQGDVDLLATTKPLDIHCVAGLLKLYLRELPTSVLTRELHPRFLKIMAENQDRQGRLRELSRLIAQLPLPNYTLLRALIAHLISIVKNHQVNKMTVRNVGIVFSPTLGIPAGVFTLMITEFETAFDGYSEEDSEVDLQPKEEDDNQDPAHLRTFSSPDTVANQPLDGVNGSLNNPASVPDSGVLSESIDDDGKSSDREVAMRHVGRQRHRNSQIYSESAPENMRILESQIQAEHLHDVMQGSTGSLSSAADHLDDSPRIGHTIGGESPLSQSTLPASHHSEPKDLLRQQSEDPSRTIPTRSASKPNPSDPGMPPVWVQSQLQASREDDPFADGNVVAGGS